MAALAGKLGAVYNNYASNDKSKLIADFQDDETWTSGAGTQSDDSTNFRLGTESIRITENDGTGGLLYSDRSSASFNLNQFESGDTSDTDDYIYFIFYVSDSTKVTNVILGFDADATYDGTNAYTYTATTITTGWNYYKVKKSAFSSSGSPNWASVDSMRVGWTSTASATGAYVSFQAIYLVDDAYEFILGNNTAYTMAAIALFYNWSLDVDAGLVDATDFDSEGWQKSVQTVKRFTATNEKYWANGNYLTTLTNGTTLAILFYVNTTNGYRYEGAAKVESVAVEVGVDDLISDSLTFTGEGELAYTALQIIDS